MAEADIFISAHQAKAYGTTMLEQLLNYCGAQSNPIYGQHIIPLLNAAKRFRNMADPGLFFSTLRNNDSAETTSYLKHQMQEITHVLMQAEAHIHESDVLAAALAYCTASIMDRLNDLEPNDKIMQIYSEGGV